MGKKRRASQQDAQVTVEQALAPDAEARLRRAYDLILRAAVRDENKHASVERDEKGAVDDEC